MGVAPMKRETAPPKWDKPVAVLLVLIAVIIAVLFILNYTGPATAAVP